MLDLAHLAELHARFDSEPRPVVRSFEVRGRRFDPHPATSLMGVVNLSPDSTHRESIALDAEAAIRRGRRLVAEGAAIVDIGAESTIPGRERIDRERQLARLLPVVRALAAEGAVVSIETYDLEIARACLESGAAVLNLTKTTETEPFYELVAAHEAAVVVCWIQGRTSVETGDLVLGDDHVGSLKGYFERETAIAEQAGVTRMWIDPGLGFGYRDIGDRAQRTRYLIDSLLTSFRLRALGWPVLQQPPSGFEFFEDEVRFGEAYYAMYALLGRVDVLRTHEVTKLRGIVRAMSAYEPRT